MSSKNKSDHRKDIDDALSSIDSLLDTASDVEIDDLPILDIEPETESAANLQKEPESEAENTTAATSQKPIRKTGRHATSTRKKKTVIKRSESRISRPESTEKQPKNTDKTNDTPAKPKSDVKEETETQRHQINDTEPTQVDNKGKKSVRTHSPAEPKTSYSTVQSDFSLTQRELPVLDEIITEREMVLIAAGKELPKQVITEKFTPKTTTDKIIELLSVHLSDYNITRLEFEYLHELIDELLDKEKNKPK